MIPVREDRIETDRSVEVGLRSPQVSEVVLGDSPVEECPVIRRIQLGEDIELVDRLGVTSVREGLPSSEEEDVLVILRRRADAREEHQNEKEDVFSEKFHLHPKNVYL